MRCFGCRATAFEASALDRMSAFARNEPSAYSRPGAALTQGMSLPSCQTLVSLSLLRWSAVNHLMGNKLAPWSCLLHGSQTTHLAWATPAFLYMLELACCKTFSTSASKKHAVRPAGRRIAGAKAMGHPALGLILSKKRLRMVTRRTEQGLHIFSQPSSGIAARSRRGVQLPSSTQLLRIAAAWIAGRHQSKLCFCHSRRPGHRQCHRLPTAEGGAPGELGADRAGRNATASASRS